MKIKRLAALITCIVILITVLAGCNNEEHDYEQYDENDYDLADEANLEDENDDAATPNIQDQFVSIDFEASFNTFAPDTVMIRGGNITVTWAELYVYLFNAVNELLSGFDMGGDWSDLLFEDMTLGDVTLGHAMEEALQLLIFAHGAYLSDVSLSADDENMLSQELESLIEMYGSRDELAAVLRAFGGFYSIELFESMIRSQHLVEVLMDALFGIGAEAFPDEYVTIYSQREGYMMAKHILRIKTEDDNETPRIELENILQQLHEYDGEDIQSFFESLVNQYSEDPGIQFYPYGYLFQFPDMVVPFSQASAGLQIGEFSDIVETDFGFHIILRVPFNYDVVPVGIEAAGQLYTLRQLAASERLVSLLEEWRDSLEIEFTPEFESIYMADIFEIIRS
jgi:parvulin-like peptidyl-prolyl isomerase